MKSFIKSLIIGITLTLSASVMILAHANPVPDLKGVYAFGSGEFINSDCDVLTAAHVIKGAVAVKILVNNTWVETKVLISDEEHDVAVLHTGLKSCPSVRFQTTVILGETVYSLGFPRPQDFEFSKILTKGIVSDANWNGLIMHQLTIAPGNSGGALFDAGGDLLGITNQGFSSGFEFASEYSMSVPSSTILKVIKDSGLDIKVNTVETDPHAATNVINISTVVMIGNFQPQPSKSNDDSIEITQSLINDQIGFIDSASIFEDWNTL